MIKKSTVVALVSLSLGAQAATIESGNDLLRLSTGSETDKAFVYGYLGGVTQSEQFAQALGEMSRGTLSGFQFYCLPATAYAGQAKDVVVKWLNDHPERRHEAAFIATRTAFLAAWPCK